MPTKKTVAPKKTVARKTAAKKVASKKSASAPVRDPLTKPNQVANEQARVSGDASSKGKPKIHAKSVSIIVSIGTEDRGRSIEDFMKEIEKRLKPVPYGEEGIHMTPTGGYYILDGKVCLPEDYDPKTGTFKKGAVPPPWAGGPKTIATTTGATQQQMIDDARNLSEDEYAKKYKIGKYRQVGTGGPIITPEMQRQKIAEVKKAKQRKLDEEVEDFEWEVEDLDDEDVLEAAATKSASRAVKKMTTAKKPTKKIVKKTTKTVAKPTAKKSVKKPVRRVKK
jgi:hypothetical protein